MVVVMLLAITMVSSGKIAVWTVIAVGLFNSIMWSNIFALSIANLGKYTSQGSSLLVMMILGGAVIPPIQGLVADYTSIQFSFIVPLVCYIYIIFYGVRGYVVKPR